MTQSARDADASNVAESYCSANVPRQRIYKYLQHSAGNCNWPTNHTIQCLIGMIETGEATFDDMQMVGGKFLVDLILEIWEI